MSDNQSPDSVPTLSEVDSIVLPALCGTLFEAPVPDSIGPSNGTGDAFKLVSATSGCPESLVSFVGSGASPQPQLTTTATNWSSQQTDCQRTTLLRGSESDELIVTSLIH